MKSNSCVQDLRLYANSPRTHSKKHLRQIAASIEKCGFRNLIDDMNQIFAGHARVEVAKPLGIQGKKGNQGI